jgi:hypothetical protein
MDGPGGSFDNEKNRTAKSLLKTKIIRTMAVGATAVIERGNGFSLSIWRFRPAHEVRKGRAYFLYK